MATKFATPELQSRMRRAVAAIGRGVNQERPEIELQGRKDLALVHIENQIRLGREYLTSTDIRSLAELLFGTEPLASTDTADANEDYTADAVETTNEALARNRPSATLLLDEDDEDF